MYNNDAAMQEVKDYLKAIKFKRSLFGGCDSEDVLSKINVVTMMFRDMINAQGDALMSSEATAERLNASCASMNAELGAMRERDQREIQALRRKALAAEELEQKNIMLMAEIVRKDGERAEYLQRAENEARRIIYRAKEQAGEIMRSKEQELDRLVTEKRRQLDKVSGELEKAVEEKSNYLTDFRVAMRMVEDEFIQILRRADEVISRADDGSGAARVDELPDSWSEKSDEKFLRDLSAAEFAS